MFKNWIYPAYARFSKPRRTQKRRGTDRGRLIQTGAVLTAILGLNTDASLIYQLFAFLFCLTLISRIGLKFHHPKISLTRNLPSYATVGEIFEYQISLTNIGNKLESDLQIRDNPLVVPPSREQFKSQKEPFEDSRNVYDRFIGFHRFIYLQRINTGIVTDQSNVPDISRHATIDTTIKAIPKRRGIVRFTSTTVLHPDPLNLNQGITQIDNPESLMILPKRYKVPSSFNLSGGRHFQPGGINAAWSIGESDEFVSLRDYRDGDSMKKIHWASTAKRNKPVVKEYQDEYFVRQALVLDTSSENTDTLEEAISLAASFTLTLNKPDSVLDLIYLSDKQEILTSGRGTDSVNKQLEALATLSRSNLGLDQLIDATLTHARLVSAYILVLSDWTKEHKRLLQCLNSAKIPIITFIITHDKSKFLNEDIDAHIMEIGEIQESLNAL
ncbi:MAG: DUF58 domain-containing protein [Pseudomonadales bacterium]|nr:DUF58 domain-containing protein [Pseudomonadales bacterium]